MLLRHSRQSGFFQGFEDTIPSCFRQSGIWYLSAARYAGQCHWFGRSPGYEKSATPGTRPEPSSWLGGM